MHAPMFTAMQLSENASGLVLTYPLWIGAAFAMLAAVAVGYAFVTRGRARRRWPLIAATLIASWAGIYFSTFNATIGAETGSVYGFLRYDHSVRWQDARDVYLERRGGEWTI